MAPSTPEEAIRRTLAQYCHLCDEGRFLEWIDLFMPDARLHVMGRTHSGRHSVRDFIERGQAAARRGRHMLSGTVVDLDVHGVEARAWTDYIFVDQHSTITSVGRYHDEFVLCEDHRWRFSLREIVFLGGAPELAQPPPG